MMKGLQKRLVAEQAEVESLQASDRTNVQEIEELRKRLASEKQLHAAAQQARKSAEMNFSTLEADMQNAKHQLQAKIQAKQQELDQLRQELNSLKESLADVRNDAKRCSPQPVITSHTSDPRLITHQAAARDPASCIFNELYASFKGKPGKHSDSHYRNQLPYDDAFEIKDSLLALCDGVGEGGFWSGTLARELAREMARTIDMDGGLFEKLEYCIDKIYRSQILSGQDVKKRPSSTMVALKIKPGIGNNEIKIDALELGDSQWALLTVIASERRCEKSLCGLMT